VSQYQKGKPNWILQKKEKGSGNGITWAICKSAPCSKQTPCQHPTTQFFTGRMPFLPPNQQRQSTEGYKALKATLSLLSNWKTDYRVTGNLNQYVYEVSELFELSDSFPVF